ncbi:MAG: efflux RND transporter periplasmic adaptor subunit [Candidatus Zixiibacteriota bacterium]
MEKIYPKFRDDLIISQQEFEKTTYFVIKDPITHKFFRVKELEYYITQQLDGKTSPEEIAQSFQDHFHIQLPLETLEKFIRNLKNFGFLEGEISDSSTLLTDQERSQRERELARLQYQKQFFWGKLLFIKLKGFDPDRLLNRLVKFSGFLFTPAFLFSSLLLILLALYITLANWKDLGYSFSGIFKVATILKVWVAIFLVIVLHEFAHALTCKHFGGEVHEMGFLLLYFQPCFYCNVSDAYLFKEKSKKLWVTFAGVCGQVLVWAIATLLWRITALDTGLNNFIFVVVITSGITVLFNFNPLIKLDGYYLLTDYLEIPNLRKKAFGYLSSRLKRKLLNQMETPTGISDRTKRIYIGYGIASLVYSALLILWVFVQATRFLVLWLGGLGFVLSLVLIFLILKQPLKAAARGIAQFLSVKKEELMVRKKKALIYAGIIGVILLILFLVRWELKIGGPCEIKALESFNLRTLSDGTVLSDLFRGGAEEKKSVNYLKLFTTDFTTLNLVTKVKEGQKVDSGQTVAELTSPSYYSNLLQVKENLRRAKDNYNLLQKGARKESIQQAKDKVAQIESELSLKEKELNRYKELIDKKLISKQEWEKVQTEYSILSNQLKIAQNDLKIMKNGSRPEELSMADTEIKRWQERLEFLEGQVSDSQIKSPIQGTVTSISSDGNLLSISNIDTIRVMIQVSEKDLDVLREGQRVKLKVQSYPFLSFWGKVTKISQMVDTSGPKKIFPVTCKIENPDHLLKPGMTGHAKVFCGKRSLFTLLTRRIVRYFRVEVWSWW